MKYKDHEYKQGIKDCIITEDSVQMTFCKTCKTCGHECHCSNGGSCCGGQCECKCCEHEIK